MSVSKDGWIPNDKLRIDGVTFGEYLTAHGNSDEAKLAIQAVMAANKPPGYWDNTPIGPDVTDLTDLFYGTCALTLDPDDITESGIAVHSAGVNTGRKRQHS